MPSQIVYECVVGMHTVWKDTCMNALRILHY